MTTTEVARHLKMRRGRVVSWIERGALPAPSLVDKNGTRYFDEEWLEKARGVLRNKRAEID